jgi:transaldolase
MDGLDYVRLLKKENPDSEVWLDAVPTGYTDFKAAMVIRYPELLNVINSLLPDHLSDYACGITGATTNPRLVNTALFQARYFWAKRVRETDEQQDLTQLRHFIYNQLIKESASKLDVMWHCSGRRYGWLSAQVDPRHSDSDSAIVEQGLELSGLAPNIMIKVPGSQAGYLAIEELVARGCSINNTFCFTVSQFAAGLDAIERGRFRARLAGVDITRARYVITFMIGRFGAEQDFGRQAQALGIELTETDKRWAELAIYDAIQTLLGATQSPVRLLLCSIKLDRDAQGEERCWHLEKTGERTTLYTLPMQLIEFLLQRQSVGRPVVPARSFEVPDEVLPKLLRIDYFSQAYRPGGLRPEEFSRHPAFITARHYADAAQGELDQFIESIQGVLPEPQLSGLLTPVGEGS